MNRKVNWLVIFLVLCIIPNCKEGVGPDDGVSEFHRGEMRNLVREISAYAKSTNEDFIVITQNGLELLTKNGRANGKQAQDYLDWIDGVGQEHVFYGLDGYDIQTSNAYRDYILGFLELAGRKDLKVLVTDYCSSPSQIYDSYSRNQDRNYISFTAPGGDYDLNAIPQYPKAPFNMNLQDVRRIDQAKNFLYLINSNFYDTSEKLLDDLRTTNYDILLIDPFFGGDRLFRPTEISSLKQKANGGSRLVIAYLNIGAAEEFRYYWQSDWQIGNPSWLAARYTNPLFDNEYWVKYWEPGWQRLLFGNDSSYVKRILDAGFDGVYLDNVEAFSYFESIQ